MSAAKEIGSELATGVFEGVYGLFLWGALLVVMVLAFVVPIAGLAVGALLFILAIVFDRGWFFPIVTIVISIWVWIGSGSALGMAPLLFS